MPAKKNSRSKIFAPLLIAATTAGSVQKVWAEVLLDEDSEEWKGESPDGIWEVVHPGGGYAGVEDGVLQLRRVGR